MWETVEELKRINNLLRKPSGFSNHRGYYFIGKYKKPNMYLVEAHNRIKYLEEKIAKSKSGFEKYKYAVAISIIENLIDEEVNK